MNREGRARPGEQTVKRPEFSPSSTNLDTELCSKMLTLCLPCRERACPLSCFYPVGFTKCEVNLQRATCKSDCTAPGLWAVAWWRRSVLVIKIRKLWREKRKKNFVTSCNLKASFQTVACTGRSASWQLKWHYQDGLTTELTWRSWLRYWCCPFRFRTI